MNVEIIEAEEGFRSLQNEWNALLAQSDADCVFLTWEWLHTWWEVFGQGRRLCLITVRDNGRLVGVAPLLIRTVRLAGLLPLRRLEFLGTGEDAADEVCSNYLDFIVAKDRAEAVRPLLLEVLTDGRVGWDQFVLESVPEQSVNLAALRAHFGRRRVFALGEHSAPCLYIELPGSFAAYLSALGQSTRHSITRDRKRLAKRGETTYGIHRGHEAAGVLDDFIDIHRRRWQDRKAVDAFSSPQFVDFHRRVIAAMAPQGWVRISFLRNAGQVVAGSYHYVYKERLFAYQVGCDDSYDRQVGTGIVEYACSIEAAVNEGCREYDFYRSNPQGYKSRLAKSLRRVVDLRFARPTWRGRALELAAGLRRLVTTLRGAQARDAA